MSLSFVALLDAARSSEAPSDVDAVFDALFDGLSGDEFAAWEIASSSFPVDDPALLPLAAIAGRVLP